MDYIPYTPQNEEEYFQQLEQWNDEDEYTPVSYTHLKMIRAACDNEKTMGMYLNMREAAKA